MALDHDKLKRAKAGSRGGFGWKPKGGDNRIRILPPGSQFLANWDALENLALPFKMHFFKIEGRPPEVSRCLEDLKQRCPACDTWRVHRKSEDPALKELAKSIGPADQYLFNILDIGNLQAGVQVWGANWTCWDKIMEIAANPLWGNVVDPADGVNFIINMTPAQQSRTGYNTYSVLPEPTRTQVMAVLDAIPNWQAALDELGTHSTEPKTADEIRSLLDELGFPSVGGPRGVSAAAPSPAAPPPPSRGPVAPPAGVAPVGGVAPVSVPGVAPVSPAPAAAVGHAAPAVHYDPGAGYTPKLADGVRPAGVPRCYGDYEPRQHRCAPCPVVSECQIQMLGIG